jgi:EAL domain-containing protein (putative c-di-GMP-specific phosphodiesterase class I)
MPPANPTPGKSAASIGRVLVAEDEEGVLRSCSLALTRAGFDVERASDGQQALTLIGQHRFDVVVSDIAMPHLSGMEVLRAVRERDLDLPVVLMTGIPEAESAIQAIEQGAFRYLVKPFGTEVLTSAVLDAARLRKLALLKREAVALVGDDLLKFGDLAGLSAAFDRALATLWMAFQPVVSVSAQRVFAYEALLRAEEPLLPHPGAILAAAERLGRLNEVGRRVRARVALAMDDAPDETIFVNLHAADLVDSELYAPASPLSSLAKRVVLEITERASLEHVKDLEDRFKELRAMGFRLAVDDLGAGYAGLTSFAQMQPEVVKFDMSLVRGIDAAPAKRRLLGSMTALFRDWNLIVVAEGVETPAERDALVALGCDVLQGYLFARPGRGFPQPRF